MYETEQDVYYHLYGQYDNKLKKSWEIRYRSQYSISFLKRIFWQMWNSNAHRLIVLEKVTVDYVLGRAGNDAIHRDVILSRHKQKKQSWM